MPEPSDSPSPRTISVTGWVLCGCLVFLLTASVPVVLYFVF